MHSCEQLRCHAQISGNANVTNVHVIVYVEFADWPELVLCEKREFSSARSSFKKKYLADVRKKHSRNQKLYAAENRPDYYACPGCNELRQIDQECDCR